MYLNIIGQVVCVLTTSACLPPCPCASASRRSSDLRADSTSADDSPEDDLIDYEENDDTVRMDLDEDLTETDYEDE